MDGVDLHIHFPAGGVGKDGPSAGVTIATSLVSLFTDRIVVSGNILLVASLIAYLKGISYRITFHSRRHSHVFLDLAMTGEITLRGVVLPVGGIKEKVIAAYRTGIKTVILPQRNSKDLKDVPEHVKVLYVLIWIKLNF